MLSNKKTMKAVSIHKSGRAQRTTVKSLLKKATISKCGTVHKLSKYVLMQHRQSLKAVMEFHSVMLVLLKWHLSIRHTQI